MKDESLENLNKEINELFLRAEQVLKERDELSDNFRRLRNEIKFLISNRNQAFFQKAQHDREEMEEIYKRIMGEIKEH